MNPLALLNKIFLKISIIPNKPITKKHSIIEEGNPGPLHYSLQKDQDIQLQLLNDHHFLSIRKSLKLIKISLKTTAWIAQLGQIWIYQINKVLEINICLQNQGINYTLKCLKTTQSYWEKNLRNNQNLN